MTNFQSLQHQLAQAIKDPSLAHQFDKRRLAIYQELIFNNIESFCSGAFPVLASLLSTKEWQSLVRNYLIDYPSHSPYFVDIAEQFLTFLSELPLPNNQPWRNELAHYEWVELHISLQEVPQNINNNFGVEKWSNKVVYLSVSDSAWALAYTFPVHKISAENAFEIKPEPTFLVVYLNTQGEVEFLQTSAITIHMLNLIEQSGKIELDELQNRLTLEPFLLNCEQSSKFIKAAITDLSEKGILTVSMSEK